MALLYDPEPAGQVDWNAYPTRGKTGEYANLTGETLHAGDTDD